MKYTIYLGIALSLLMSCGEKKDKRSLEQIIEAKDLQAIKTRKQELESQYSTISVELHKINDAIDELSGKKKLPLVTVYVAKDTLFQHKITVQGSVDTRQNTMLVPEFSGALKGIYVTEGQRVNKGELIAKIDDSGISQQLAQVEIQYSLAKTTFERQERLWKKKIGSEIQYLQAKTQKEALEKNINQIKAQLAKTEVRAPYAGTIDDIPVKRGTMVLAGQTPIARLLNLSNMYIRADIPETYLGKIRKGTIAEINFPAINKTMSGKIRKTGSFINPNNRTFYIEANIPKQSKLIKPNLMAILEMADYTNKKAIVIPENIIQQDAQGNSYVFIVTNENGKNIARKRIITKGLTQGYYSEITEGLQPKEILISEGSGNMQDGLEVEVKN